MIAIILIALAAGCASALMFASIISGALISLLLFYLAPLPLMVAALGWGPLAATIGGIAAADGLGAIFGLPYCIAFAHHGRAAGLVARPSRAAGPPGRQCRTAATARRRPRPPWNGIRSAASCSGSPALPSLTTIAALLTLGTDADSHHRAPCGAACCAMLGPRDATSSRRHRAMDRCAGRSIAPAAAAIVAMMTLTLNLWLAAKITATSGRLHRPWPDLKSTALPPMTLVGVVGRARVLLHRRAARDPGADRQRGADDGLRADRLRGAAHADAGAEEPRALAGLHLRRRAWCSSGRSLAMVALGLADAIFGFRQRYLRGQAAAPARVLKF